MLKIRFFDCDILDMNVLHKIFNGFPLIQHIFTCVNAAQFSKLVEISVFLTEKKAEEKHLFSMKSDSSSKPYYSHLYVANETYFTSICFLFIHSVWCYSRQDHRFFSLHC